MLGVRSAGRDVLGEHLEIAGPFLGGQTGQPLADESRQDQPP